jgi:hypothetical protein
MTRPVPAIGPVAAAPVTWPRPARRGDDWVPGFPERALSPVESFAGLPGGLSGKRPGDRDRPRASCAATVPRRAQQLTASPVSSIPVTWRVEGSVGGDILMKKIYLCGPIMDEKNGKARAWRKTATERLATDFIILDPMRRNFKDREVDSANEIVEFDLQDVRDADIVLVNYNKPSIGTAMEVFFASHDLGKFVVAFSPFKFKDCNPWMVKFSTKILPSLESAVDYIREHFLIRQRA